MQRRFRNPIVSIVCFFSAMFLISISVVSAHAAERPATSPPDVLTYHGDTLRTGWFSSESQLTTSNVNAQSFGRLNTVALDGRVDAEPLYVSQLTIPGRGTRNVLFVVTDE